MLSNNIEVSVYCMAYNHEKYIRKTLDGFISQITNFEFEVIIHDDASTDSTALIIREYEEKYPNIIKAIYQKENQYSQNISAFNKFIFPMMSGKYIAVCEGDDYWCDEKKLQKQYDALEAHPECSISTHLVKCCRENGEMLEKVHPDDKYHIKGSGVINKNKLASCYWIRGSYPFHTSSYFYRRIVRERIINELKIEKCYDITLLKAALKDGKVYYIDSPMSVRRMDSVGNWNSRHNVISTRDTFNKYIEKNDLLIDRFLCGKYHSIIYTSMLLSNLRRYKYYPRVAHNNIVKKELYFYKYYKYIPRNHRWKFFIKYVVLRYAPSIFEVIYKKNIKNVDSIFINKNY